MVVQEVNLVGVKIHAGHGFYPQEQQIGNVFLVDVFTKFIPQSSVDTEELVHTVNYEQLHVIVQEVMCTTQLLLETLVQDILTKILVEFGFLMEIKVCVKKLHPPMGGEIAYSEVVRTYIKSE